MRKSFLFIFFALLCLAGQGVAEAPTSVTLQARAIAGSRNESQTARPKQATRETTGHASELEITVGTLGAAEEITVRWFWLGKYESSGNFFRSGDGEKVVTLDPTKAQTVIAQGAEIESHYTKSKKGSSYVSGGRMVGWIVSAWNSQGKIIATKASDPLFLPFATRPPAKQRK